jgi:hypothetical protein
VADADRRNAGGRSWPWLGTLLIALPFFYLLSIGPVAAITSGMDRSNLEFAEKFYAPVIWLHDHTPLKEPLEYYVMFWGGK